MAIKLIDEFNDIINNIDLKNKPNLFLHVCCAPCSSAVLEKIISFFNIYIIFYNPNIDTKSEYDKRLGELYKLIKLTKYDVNIIYTGYNHDEYLEFINGYEKELEGGMRCSKCFYLRLKFSYDFARDYILSNDLRNHKNYLCTTLSISPHKNAELIAEIGKNICIDSDLLTYLPSDFKKENGYLRSIQLSKVYGLYRQDYCGCEFAKCIK